MDHNEDVFWKIDMEFRQELLERKQPQQQRSKNLLTQNLLLDLDATLIHASTDPLDIVGANDTLNVTYKIVSLHNNLLPSQYELWYVRIRPGALELLKTLRHLYNIFIYTSAKRDYAVQCCSLLCDEYSDLLIPTCNIFTREDQAQLSVLELKDMRILNQYLRYELCSLENTLIVDDRMEVWDVSNHANIFVVPPFESSHRYADDVLNHLLRFLCMSDVSTVLSARSQVLTNCVLYLHEFANPLLLKPFFNSLADLAFMLEQHGATIVTALYPGSPPSHLVWIDSDSQILYPPELLMASRTHLPHVVHWSWLLHTIYFRSIASEPWFCKPNELHAFTAFQDRPIIVCITQRIDNFTARKSIFISLSPTL